LKVEGKHIFKKWSLQLKSLVVQQATGGAFISISGTSRMRGERTKPEKGLSEDSLEG
jgi:hypothetical protein